MAATLTNQPSAVNPDRSTTYSVQEIAEILGISKNQPINYANSKFLYPRESAELYGLTGYPLRTG